jgi:hypothetical protein
MKHFENWVLVGLIHELLDTGIGSEVRTNGHFPDALGVYKKVLARDVTGIGSRKAKAKRLSVDLSVRLASGQRFSAEINGGTMRAAR